MAELPNTTLVSDTINFRITVQDVYNGRVSGNKLVHSMIIVKREDLDAVLPASAVEACITNYPDLQLEDGLVAVTYLPLAGIVTAHIGDGYFSWNITAKKLYFYPQYNMYVPDSRKFTDGYQLYFTKARTEYESKLVLGKWNEANHIIARVIKDGGIMSNERAYQIDSLIPVRPGRSWISEGTYFDLVEIYQSL